MKFMFTSGTPSLRHAAMKFSTLRRHLAALSFGWTDRKIAQIFIRNQIKNSLLVNKQIWDQLPPNKDHTFAFWDTRLYFGHNENKIRALAHHCRWGDVDDWHGTRSHVIGQLAENCAIGQRLSQIVRQRDLQTWLQTLEEKHGKSDTTGKYFLNYAIR